MSDSEEPTVTFVCKKENGDARGGGPLHMYRPKRRPPVSMSNGSSNNNDDEPPRNSRRDHQTEGMIAAANNGPEKDFIPSTIKVAPNRRSLLERGVSSPHIEVSGSDSISYPQERRLSSSINACVSEPASQDDVNMSLHNRLTNQRWHEIGNGEYPVCATNDFDLMVKQLTEVLAARLTELLLHRLHKARKMRQNGEEYEGGSMADFLQLDVEVRNYVLADEVMDSLREYVASIGRLHNDVGFHSFEHCTHVFLSMNKLLSMVTTADDLNVTAKRRLSAQDIASTAFAQSRRSSVDSTSSADSEGHRRRAEHLSFRISEDPAIRFAMVFSALIHDVGEYIIGCRFRPFVPSLITLIANIISDLRIAKPISYCRAYWSSKLGIN